MAKIMIVAMLLAIIVTIIKVMIILMVVVMIAGSSYVCTGKPEGRQCTSLACALLSLSKEHRTLALAASKMYSSEPPKYYLVDECSQRAG